MDLDQRESKMTSDELFKMHRELCETALLLMKSKNHDYAGKNGMEPFANFTRAETMGITSTEKGMMVRMIDKISRISSFIDNGKFKVDDEKLKDTIIDIINYSILLYAYIDNKNSKDYSIVELHNPLPEDNYDLYSKGSVVPNTVDTV